MMDPVPPKKAGIRFPCPKATKSLVQTRKPKRTKTLLKMVAATFLRASVMPKAIPKRQSRGQEMG